MARFIIIYRGEFYVEVEASSADEAVIKAENREDWRFCGKVFDPDHLVVIEEVTDF